MSEEKKDQGAALAGAVGAVLSGFMNAAAAERTREERRTKALEDIAAAAGALVRAVAQLSEHQRRGVVLPAAAAPAAPAVEAPAEVPAAPSGEAQNAAPATTDPVAEKPSEPADGLKAEQGADSEKGIPANMEEGEVRKHLRARMMEYLNEVRSQPEKLKAFKEFCIENGYRDPDKIPADTLDDAWRKIAQHGVRL